ncbi:DUF1579 family protein [Actinomadura rudentiformis]|uniref:DUF1579 domain-containing protein n=1 Tax=Actinomadura rudentiformis TaxID=359158 RepID=A0A6H9YE00_9ACTN|nr:DUF1579 family protein [Actinomadura rudentiformis]KAB2342498.1 DUF1579 domain-containing protein [Actinomadura rudentiformis]
MTAPRSENKRLDVLVGSWRSEGWTVAADGVPPVRIAGSDTYEWLAGGFFLVHRVDVRMNGDRVEVIEMIGPYDPVTGTYPMRSFDNQGDFVTMHATVDDHGVWTFAGETERATLTVAEDGTTMSAKWERTDDGSTWLHWMDMAFTRER